MCFYSSTVPIKNEVIIYVWFETSDLDQYIYALGEKGFAYTQIHSHWPRSMKRYRPCELGWLIFVELFEVIDWDSHLTWVKDTRFEKYSW